MHNSLLLRNINPTAKASWTFENSLLDKTKNQYTALNVGGTVPFSTVNTYAGKFALGPTTDSVYANLPNSFLTAISSPTSKFQLGEMYFYCNSIANSPVILSSPFGGFDHFIQIGSTGWVKSFWAGGNTQTGNIISTGKWYYLAFCTDCRTAGNSLEKVWCCEATKIPTNYYNNHTAISAFGLYGSTQIGTALAGKWYVGRYYSVSGYALNGYIKNFKFTNIVPNKLPLMD